MVSSTVTPGGGEVLDHAPQLDPALRVEAGGGLVEEQHRRTVHERGGEVEPPAHPAREGAHDAVGGVGEREVLEQLVRRAARCRRRHVRELPDHLEVLARR